MGLWLTLRARPRVDAGAPTARARARGDASARVDLAVAGMAERPDRGGSRSCRASAPGTTPRRSALGTRGRGEGGRAAVARRWRLALGGARGGGRDELEQWGEGTQIEPAAARRGTPRTTSRRTRADEPGWRAAIGEEGRGRGPEGGSSSGGGRNLGARAVPGCVGRGRGTWRGGWRAPGSTRGARGRFPRTAPPGGGRSSDAIRRDGSAVAEGRDFTASIVYTKVV